MREHPIAKEARLINLMTTLAIFDLDYTLLNGDSEQLWSEFLVRRGVLPSVYTQRYNAFMLQYDQGQMDFAAYTAFVRQPFLELDPGLVLKLREEFLAGLQPYLRPYMLARIAWHTAQGHTLMVITLSNRFISEPIVARMGIHNLICTSLEFKDGKFSADLNEEAPYREAKVRRLQAWAAPYGYSLDGSWGYSDSQNDLPLLNAVAHPVAVTPDVVLREAARQQNWEIIEP